MKPALLVFCCAIAAAWLLPRPLGRLSGAGASPRRPAGHHRAHHRLADPPPCARWLCHGLALAALTLAIAVGSALVPVFAVTGI